jgi:hypothetical protein
MLLVCQSHFRKSYCKRYEHFLKFQFCFRSRLDGHCFGISVLLIIRFQFCFRSRLDGHCLGVLFSNKAFPSRVLGLAWKGDAKKQSGICQKRRKEVLLKNYKESADLNLNSLFITLRTKAMQRIPLR